eukprot:TRINITY_DN9509_c0_g2_i2.p1 TRINITY_DN9509_c0_g2~~TRINITY_DN9509_c0_g2_i2.p1  ORF type:complete len:328 (+),score=79.58 TRINITY_DN9509_c0_g2_i2:53-1036(+)
MGCGSSQSKGRKEDYRTAEAVQVREHTGDPAQEKQADTPRGDTDPPADKKSQASDELRTRPEGQQPAPKETAQESQPDPAVSNGLEDSGPSSPAGGGRSTVPPLSAPEDSVSSAAGQRVTQRLSRSTVGTAGPSIQRVATSATIPTLGGGEEEDEDDLITQRVLKLREQSLQECREAGGCSSVRVAGVPFTDLRVAVEMTSREIDRFRKWADLVPPFDPIPVLEPGGDAGRQPREALLRMNQELLDTHERERVSDRKAKSLPQVTSRGNVAHAGSMSPSRSNLQTPVTDSNFGRASGLDDGGGTRVRASQHPFSDASPLMSPARSAT